MGMRLALLEAKMALVAVLRRVRLVAGERTVTEIKHDPASISGGYLGGLWVKAARREQHK